MDAVALVVAAGRGHRFGGALPKQYASLGGRPLLARTLGVFARHPRIDAVRAVIHPDDRGLYEQASAGLALLGPVDGGASRQDSVRRGLESLADQGPASVLIHDGARPFVSDAVIDRVLDALETGPGAIAAVPVTDTLKREDRGRIEGTVDRRALWRAQTPQGFRFAEILAAHRAAAARSVELTDDAAVAEHAGLAVALIEDSVDNVKITGPEDLARAERVLAGTQVTEYRSGSGYDVHRFGPGDHVTLCGIPVAHEHGLVGHSDADVGLHALTDAIFGALALGDLGDHFPPGDPQWKDADSGIFLRHACALATARGAQLVNADITIICEKPKIRPQRAAMITRVAGLLGIEAERVSIKATTTEGLGFTGRREGIAAQASVTLAVTRPTPALEVPADRETSG